jgi:hypothetical protein
MYIRWCQDGGMIVQLAYVCNYMSLEHMGFKIICYITEEDNKVCISTVLSKVEVLNTHNMI